MARDIRKRRIPLWYNPSALLGIIFGTIALLVTGVALIAIYADHGLAPFRCLPSDEEMIANFYKHRQDFERLVRIYRECPNIPLRGGALIGGTPEINAIMQRINITVVDNDSRLWLPPAPYSDAARQQIEARELAIKLIRGRLEARQYTGVVLFYRHKTVRRWDQYFTKVFKCYYYTPVVPKIADGYLLQPRGWVKVVPMLNKYPSDFGEKWGCVYRQFEPRWFIRMCETP